MTEKKYDMTELVELDCGDCVLQVKAESALVGYEYENGKRTTVHKKYPPTLDIALFEPAGWGREDHGPIAAVKRAWNALRRRHPTWVEMSNPTDVDSLIAALQRGRAMMDETWDPTVTP